MPVRDPHSGYAFVWLVSFTLFLFLAAGGGCLVMYMILPESQTSSWLAITGVTLVCLPWLFWFVTCMYRIISRVLGFRMVVGFGCDGGGGSSGAGSRGGGSHNLANSHSTRSGGNNNDTSMSNNGSAPVPTEYPSVEVKYEGDGTENNNGRERRDNKEGNKQTPSSSNNSIASRESEIPLTSSVS